jgi:type II secretory pathway pseudopilin PulG
MSVRGVHGGRGGRATIAFTLVELLVVVAIIALLVGIILPSLAQAREQARLAKCLGNLQQLGNTMHQYFGEYADTFPWFDTWVYKVGILPSLGASWYYGGRYPPIDAFGDLPFESAQRLRYYPKQRPFNRYLYPQARGAKAEAQLYLCPSDRSVIGYGAPGVTVHPHGSYDMLGTSYLANVYWQHISQFVPNYAFIKSFADYGNQLTRYKLNVRGSGTFVILFPQHLTATLALRTALRGRHGGIGFNEILFLDGHAEYLLTDPSGGWRARHAEWTLWFSELDRDVPAQFRPPFPGVENLHHP